MTNEGDLISREALKKAFLSYDYLNMGNYTMSMFEIIKVIDNAPTVELFCSYLSDKEVRQPCVEAPCKHERPQDNITEEDIQNAIKAGYENGYSMAQAKYQRQQGEWITFPTNHSIIQCPECTALINNLRVDVFKDKVGKMNFCPNCGADMRGDKE